MQQDKFVDAPDAIQLSRREGLRAQLLELENAFTDAPTPGTQPKGDDAPCAIGKQFLSIIFPISEQAHIGVDIPSPDDEVKKQLQWELVTQDCLYRLEHLQLHDASHSST